MKRLSILRGAGNREKVKFAPVAEQGIRSMFKPCRGNLMRVQVSPGAFSQCVGNWKTRWFQKPLLKQRASSNLVTAILYICPYGGIWQTRVI